MLGRPAREHLDVGSGEFSAEAKSEAEPLWTDVASDEPTVEETPWRETEAPGAEPPRAPEYESPPFYDETLPESDDRHPSALSRLGPPAGFGRRLIAHLIDLTVTLLMLGLLFPLLLGMPLFDFDATAVDSELDTNDETNVPFVTLAPAEEDESAQLNEEDIALTDLLPWYGTLSGTILFLVLPIVYNTLLIGIWGTTIGKRLLNVYVLDKGGNVPGVPIAFMRAVTSVVSANVLYIGHLFIFRTDHRALHDLLVGTYPITRSSRDGPAAPGEELMD